MYSFKSVRARPCVVAARTATHFIDVSAATLPLRLEMISWGVPPPFLSFSLCVGLVLVDVGLLTSSRVSASAGLQIVPAIVHPLTSPCRGS